MKSVAEEKTFTTISGRPIEPLYRPEDVARHRLRPRPRRSRPVSLHPRHPRDDVPRPALDHAPVRGLRLGRGRRTSASSTCSTTGSHGLSVAFDLPTLMGRDPDHPLSLGEVGKCGVAVTSLARHGDALRRHPPRPGLDLDDHQLPGGHDARLLHRRGREAGRGPREALRAPSRTTS